MNVFSLVLIGTCLLTSVAMAEDKPLMANYRGKDRIPDELYKIYGQLVAAFKKGDRAAIERICLPQSVKITTGLRPKEKRNLATDLNLPFARDAFSGEILKGGFSEECVFRLRTGSSYLGFVNTKSAGWRLYDYGDKPIN